jgi:hypothetical protein
LNGGAEDEVQLSAVRSSLPIRRLSLKDDGHPSPDIPRSPEDRVAMMWQLALQAWMFKEGLIDEPRLRRDVVRTIRGRG